jgi:IS1 family transposase
MRFHNEQIRDIPARRVQCDEIWSFVYSKQKNTPDTRQNAGDVWTWVGIDADTKLIISWIVGKRDLKTANVFMQDLAARLRDRVQLTTDGYKPYQDAVNNAFWDGIDFAVLNKLYGIPDKPHPITGKRNNVKQYIGADIIIKEGNPNKKHISTSYIERQNLTMRTNIRRLTRKTNAFSKKIENHRHAQALHFVYYNFVRIHKSLRVAPAMEAKLIKRIMTLDDLVNIIYD